jgi:hypothetical protein
MARYEGVDEILQRVRDRLQAPETATEQPPPEPVPAFTVTMHEQQYVRALDAISTLQHHAELLRDALSSEIASVLTPDQHEHLRRQLGQALHELWAVEEALQHRAPFE